MNVRPKMKAEKESFSWASATFAASLLFILVVLIHSGKGASLTFYWKTALVDICQGLIKQVVARVKTDLF